MNLIAKHARELALKKKGVKQLISNNEWLYSANLLLLSNVPAKSSQLVGDMGCMDDLLEAMRQHPDNVPLLTATCNALWSLTVNGGLM